MTERTDRGRDIVQRTFGGALYQQGRGFYSALEFLAIVRGELLLEQAEARFEPGPERVLPEADPVLYLRPSHDHARRLLVADDDVVPGVFAGVDTRDAIKALLRGLEAPVPGRRRPPDKWQARHLYPYPPEAIHYDAVERRSRVKVERYQFRGAGGLAHRILRTDPDKDRLAESRSRFKEFLSNTETSVGKLLIALAKHDAVPATSSEAAEDLDSIRRSAFRDDVEEKSLRLFRDSPGESFYSCETRWMRLLREGVHRILVRHFLSDFDRIDDLMHWIPWCIGQHQLAMARRHLGIDEDTPAVFDAGHKKSHVRAIARKNFGEATATVKESLLAVARSQGCAELMTGSTGWWTGSRSFFTTTMYAVGALNANAGHRHYELRPEFLQAVVHALVPVPVSLKRFTGEVLGSELRIVCDQSSAAKAGAVEVDGRHLQTNGEQLAARLDEVGLLRAFSDSTLMVGAQE